MYALSVKMQPSMCCSDNRKCPELLVPLLTSAIVSRAILPTFGFFVCFILMLPVGLSWIFIGVLGGQQRSTTYIVRKFCTSVNCARNDLNKFYIRPYLATVIFEAYFMLQ